MNNKPGKMQRVIEFFEGKGFYIILILCLVAIGVSAYVLFFSINPEIPDIEPIDYLVDDPVWTPAPPQDLTGGNDSKPVAGPAEIVVEEPTVKPSPSPKPSPTPTVKPSPSPTPTPAPKLYVWPVTGKVAVPYSKDELIYDETMGDWRAHLGIDIEAAVNAKVVCAADGKVVDVYLDDLMGSTVIVEHGGGIRSIYCNLNKKPAVTIGQEVKAGDIIGAVGDTAIAEWGVVSHLHFEMAKDGTFVNPLDYLPKAN